jgi:hypothetical protein
VFSWNKEQSDAAGNSKDRSVVKHSSVADVLPQQTSDNARNEMPAGERVRIAAKMIPAY